MSSSRLATLTLLLALAGVARADKKLDDAVAKAEEQVRKGHPEEALKTLQKAASQAASDPAAHQALARLQARLGNLDAALASYRKAAQVAAAAPARSSALAELALFELRVAPAAEARAHAEQAAAAHESAVGWAALTLAQVRSGQLEAALANSERALAAGSTSALAHVARGEALLASGRSAEAVAAFRRARELEPGSVAAAAGLARALAAHEEGPAAVEAARQAVALDDKSGEALAALALALLAGDPTDAKNEAIAQVQQGTFLEPRNAQLKLIAARVFEARGQFDQAGATYREAATLDPGLASARLAPAELHYRRHAWDAALAELAQLPPAEREGAEALLLEGRVRLAKEDYPGAAAAFEKAARLRPDSAEVQSLLGTAWYQANQAEKAAVAYKRAAELEPTNSTYVANYALLLGYSGKPEQAAQVLQKLVSRPGYADPAGFINLGWLYRAMRPTRVEQAVAAYERALRLDAKSGQAAYGIALTYYTAKRWDEAIRAFNRAVAVDKRLSGDATNAIGWCYYFQRDMARARAKAEDAQQAGVPDADDLLTAIQRYQEAVKLGEERARAAMNDALTKQRAEGGAAGATGDLSGLVAQLREGNPSQQKQAAERLCRVGREAVPYLAHALLQADIDAKEIIVPCLGGLAGAACRALPMLDRLIAEGPPTPDPNATPQRLKWEMREGDLIRAMKAAVARIRPACP